MLLIRCLLLVGLAASSQIRSAENDQLTTEAKAQILEQIRTALVRRAFVFGVDFSSWDRAIHERRAPIDKANEPAEFAKLINEALATFGVSHLSLLTPEEAESRRSGKSATSGIRAGKEGDHIVVHAVRKGSPAQTKVRIGDVIVAIDGRPNASLEALSANVGERRALTILRAGKRIESKIDFFEWKLPPDTLTWPSKDIAMISVQSFSSANYDRALIESHFLEAARARLVVIDLRGNGGGNALNVEHLSGMVLPRRMILGTFVEKADAERFKLQNPGRNGTLLEIAAQAQMVQRANSGNLQRPIKADVIVVTDRSNASGAELFATAIQETKRGRIFGARTRGKVLLGENHKLRDGFELQVVVADYVTPLGRRIEGTGVVPDVELESNELSSDSALIRRIADAK